MQNKPNLDKDQNKPNPLYKKDLRKFYTPSDNEKQTQYKPNQSQYKANQTQNKPNTNPKQSQFQTRSEAEIPTGELLGILKPGTNFKPSACEDTNGFPRKEKTAFMREDVRWRAKQEKRR